MNAVSSLPGRGSSALPVNALGNNPLTFALIVFIFFVSSLFGGNRLVVITYDAPGNYLRTPGDLNRNITHGYSHN